MIDRRTRVLIERYAFIILGFVLAAAAIPITRNMVSSFLDMGIMGFTMSAVIGVVFTYLMIRHVQGEI